MRSEDKRLRKRLFSLTLFAALVPSFHSLSEDRSPAQQAVVRGEIVRRGPDRLSGFYVLRIKPAAETLKAGLRVRVARGANGKPHRFEIGDLEAGEYLLTGFASGHRIEKKVSVKPGQVTDLTLSKKDAVERYRKYALMYGRVLNGATREPVKGLQFGWRFHDLTTGSPSCTSSGERTNEYGEYFLSVGQLVRGAELAISADGYVEVIHQIDSTPDELHYDIVLQPFSGDKFCVLKTPDGFPIPGEVVFTGETRVEPRRRKVAADGVLALDGIPAGKCVIVMHYNSYQFQRSRGYYRSRFEKTLEITGKPQRMAFTEDIGRILKVTVRSKEGTLKRPRLWVRVTESGKTSGWNNFDHGNTPEDLTWFFGGVPRTGTLELVATAFGDGRYYGAQRMPLTDIGETRTIVLDMHRLTQVSVRVVDERGEAVEGAYATTRPLIANYRFTGVRFSSGRSPLAALGSSLSGMFLSTPRDQEKGYQLSFSEEVGEDLYILSSKGGSVLQQATLRDLSDGDTIQLRMHDFLVGEVVSSARYRPYPIVVRLKGGRTLRTMTNPDGTFCIPVDEPPASVAVPRVAAKNPRLGSYLKIEIE